LREAPEVSRKCWHFLKEKRMANSYTLKVYPAGKGRDVYRVLEISGDKTLDELCSAILDAFEFIDERLYEFCMDNRMYSDYSYQSDPKDGALSTKVKVDRIGLVKGQNFSLHYDFGDDWMFAIHVQKITPESMENTVRVIKEKGHIEQYLDWDDDRDDEEDE